MSGCIAHEYSIDGIMRETHAMSTWQLSYNLCCDAQYIDDAVDNRFV